MKNSIIYRIQDEVGSGMYMSSKAPILPIDFTDRHPAPWEDSKLEEWFETESIDDFKFGFSSKKQLLSWVYKTGWIKKLHKNGFVLAKVTTNDYRKGNTQAVYKMGSEQKVEICSLLTLL